MTLMAVETLFPGVTDPSVEVSLPISGVERAVDILGNNPLRMLNYLVLAAGADGPQTATEQARQIHTLQGRPMDYRADYALAKILLGSCRRMLAPSGLIAPSPLPKGGRGTAYLAVSSTIEDSEAAAGALMDWELQFPQHRLSDMYGDSRPTSTRGMPLTCLDIYGLLLRDPDQPMSLGQIRNLLGRAKPAINRTLTEQLRKNTLVGSNGNYALNPMMRPAVADLVLRVRQLRNPKFALAARQRAHSILDSPEDVNLLLYKYEGKVFPERGIPGSTITRRRLGSLTLRRIPMPRHWRNKAACRGTEPDPDTGAELFFPIGTKGPAITQTEKAKAICAPCPVAAACLQWSIDTGQQHGVFGGMTPEDRRKYLTKPLVPELNRPDSNSVVNRHLSQELEAIALMQPRKTT
jgi:WhiB family redox-sensing transcriptional regulator